MNRIQVLLIGWPDHAPRPSTPGESFEEQSFDFISTMLSPSGIDLSEDHAHVILTVGDGDYTAMAAMPSDFRRRWHHYDTVPDPQTAGIDIMTTFMRNALSPEGDFQFDNAPLVSVITPTHGKGANLQRCLKSLKRQTYTNWEWVLYVNGDGINQLGGRTGIAFDLSEGEPRVHPIHDFNVPVSIGAIKRRAFGCARGSLLLELDHDDELTPNALTDLVAASIEHPECGFFYSDCAEVEDGTYAPRLYPEGWGMGHGSYRTETVVTVEKPDGVSLNVLTNVTNYPPINLKTLSHIVGMPNHYRAWRRSAYHAAGAHSPELFVADDYELMLRTFLTTRMCHIQELGYIQHEMTGVNSQDSRRPEIQRLVRWIWNNYRTKVEGRVSALIVEHPQSGIVGEHLEVQWKRDVPKVKLAVVS